MSHVAATETIVPKALNTADKARLIDALYDVHCQIFDGVDKDSFVRYVVDSAAEHTWINVHRNERGRIVGYIAVHIFERTIGGEDLSVVRCEAGLLSGYRGANVNTHAAADRILRYMLANPGRRLYYFGSLVHPSSYSVIARYADEVWPSPNKATPPRITALMTELGAEFHLDPVDASNPFVRKVGWQTRDTEADRRYWLSGDKPEARFFLEQNPGYTEGHGLLTLVPISLPRVVRAIGLFTRSKARRRAQAVASTVGARLHALGDRLESAFGPRAAAA